MDFDELIISDGRTMLTTTVSEYLYAPEVAFKNGSFIKALPICTTKIVDYNVFNDKVVTVKFADGTTEKATCDYLDEFDFERAIEVIIMKKIFGKQTYNKLIKNAIKDCNNIDDAKKKKAEEEEIIARKKKKSADKRAKKKAKQREARIQEQKEAYVLALKEIAGKK